MAGAQGQTWNRDAGSAADSDIAGEPSDSGDSGDAGDDDDGGPDATDQ